MIWYTLYIFNFSLVYSMSIDGRLVEWNSATLQSSRVFQIPADTGPILGFHMETEKNIIWACKLRFESCMWFFIWSFRSVVLPVCFTVCQKQNRSTNRQTELQTWPTIALITHDRKESLTRKINLCKACECVCARPCACARASSILRAEAAQQELLSSLSQFCKIMWKRCAVNVLRREK